MKVRNVNNLEFIKCIQVLTENGICYSTNNFLAPNLSTRFRKQLLVNHIYSTFIQYSSQYFKNKPPAYDPFYKNYKLHDVRFGNLFDGDMTYSFIGFEMAITIYLHSPYDFMNIARGLGYSTEVGRVHFAHHNSKSKLQ